MSQTSTKIYKRPEFYIIIIAAVMRIVLGQLLGAWVLPGSHDDELLISYAFLPEHFTTLDTLSLVKDMGYPIFLNFVHYTGLSYTMVLSIIWVVAALLVTRVFHYLTENRIFLTCTYLFILFTPAAFDAWMGTRAYRNSIIAPFALLVFALILLILFKILKDRNIIARKLTVISMVLGVIFAFAYYIKEDGIWLLACMAFGLVVCIGIVAFRFVKGKKTAQAGKGFVKMVAVLCLPLVIFALLTNVYKLINYNFFGVYETNTRTSGELGEYVNNVYRVYAEDRTASIWAPPDAIEKTFEASPTLQQYPELLEHITNNVWFGDMHQTPIPGDYLTWVLRDALRFSGVWESERQVSDLFAQVNIELEEAFKTDELQEDDKFQLVSSAGGRTLDEILELKSAIALQYKIVITLEAFEPGGVERPYFSDDAYGQNPAVYEKMTTLSNMNFLPLSGSAQYMHAKEIGYGNSAATLIFRIYSILNPILCVFTLIGLIATIIMGLVNRIRKKRPGQSMSLTVVLIVIVLAGITLAYSLGIAWFSGFIGAGDINLVILKFYSVGLVPVMALLELFGTYLFVKFIKGLFMKRQGMERQT